MSDIALSIVTVCFNAAQTIERTILSVFNQTYRNYEYIIIDGKSIDTTNLIIKKYIPLFQEKGIVVKYISESDSGIYDAMNKGIHLAEGRWIQFLNADDRYCDNNVLCKIFCSNDIEKFDILYGEAYYFNKTHKWAKVSYPLNKLCEYMTISHQATFVKTDLCRTQPFDTRYKISADYNMILQFYLKGYSFYELNFPIVDFCTEGISNQCIWKCELEDMKIRHNLGIRNMYLPTTIIYEILKYVKRVVYSKCKK